MSSVNEIEEAALRLTPPELDAFRTWFAEFDAKAWTGKWKMTSRRDGWTRVRGRRPRRSTGWTLHRSVRHRANPRFCACDRQLPDDRRLADESYQLLRRDPKHPSLHFKKLERFWSARVGLPYRALAVEHENVMVWFWVGTHAVYNRRVSGR